MTANNFLTAEQLKISDAIRDPLIKTLFQFENGDVTYDPTMHTQAKGFNLGSLVTKHENGVCGCIFGWTAMNAGILLDPSINKVAVAPVVAFLGAADPKLRELFWGPPDRQWDLSVVTLEQAIVAIRNYLQTGFPNWGTVFS